MNIDNTLRSLGKLLLLEEIGIDETKKKLSFVLESSREKQIELIRNVANSQDLSLIISVEKMIIEGDLNRYSNSKAMESSLKTALNQMSVIENLISIVDDYTKYTFVDQMHSMSKNRISGLPKDEARQAFSSHYARLNNMDKARLSDTEKKLIDARKSAIWNASKLYIDRQAKTLGVELKHGRGRKF